MGSQMKNAIEQMQKKEEAGLNYLYSKTYNYVYLRAKSLLNKETDIQNLMKEVYIQAFSAADGLKEEEVYGWLGKRTYALGTKFYRRKKAREATCIEFDRNELAGKKSNNDKMTAEVLGNAMEQLPELYQATFYAFYYDYMSVEDISQVMDCSTNVILYRLNYTNKFVKEAFAMYNEESGKEAKIAFSAENICSALRQWSVEHCLGMASAQTLYSNICKELKLKAGSIYLEGKEFAGVNNTVVYHKLDDMTPLFEEIERYGAKTGPDKKKIAIIGACIAALILLVVIIAALPKDKDDAKEPQNDKVQEEVEDQENENNEAVLDGTENDDMMVEPNEDAEVDEPEVTDDPEVTDELEVTDEPEVQDNTASEYILPKSNSEQLTAADLEGLSKAELRLARNEIYARNGMIFGIDDLDEYFKGKSWYTPKYRSDEFYDTVEMSIIEETNVDFILQKEKSMN